MKITELIDLYQKRKYEENAKFIDILLDVRSNNPDVVDGFLAEYSKYTDDYVINAARIRGVLTEIMDSTQGEKDNGIVSEGADSLVGVGPEPTG